MERTASITRDTSETHISMTLNLDGSGRGNISTGIGFLDHMLNSFARHGFFDLDLTVKGDLEVDTHHTIEDTGIVLGQAIRKAVGDKKGIMRYGSQILPMDESLVLCALDLCGRPYLVCDLVLDREKVGDLILIILMSGSNLLRQKVWNILRLKIIRLEMRIFTLKGKKMGKWSRF